jgi:hypothetical protein
MQLRETEFERVRKVLAAADSGEGLTAREIQELLAEHGGALDSSHRVATVLGRRARRGDVEVIEDRPYRYRLRSPPSDADAGSAGRATRS